jgi:hypothetical protein
MKETRATRCVHGGKRCSNDGLDTQYARMWIFHNLVVTQNEGGGTYLN